VGISNVVEIGMVLPEVKELTRDLLVEHGKASGDLVVEVPSLGASLTLGKESKNVESLHFVTDLGKYPPESLSDGFQAFKGTLPCGLSFSGRGIFRTNITEIYGMPSVLLDQTTLPLNQLRNSQGRLASLLRQGESVACQTTEGIEVLYYPGRGIAFKLWNDKVYAVEVTRCYRPESGGER
jgi:hypothetical protein